MTDYHERGGKEKTQISTLENKLREGRVRPCEFLQTLQELRALKVTFVQKRGRYEREVANRRRKPYPTEEEMLAQVEKELEEWDTLRQQALDTPHLSDLEEVYTPGKKMWMLRDKLGLFAQLNKMYIVDGESMKRFMVRVKAGLSACTRGQKAVVMQALSEPSKEEYIQILSQEDINRQEAEKAEQSKIIAETKARELEERMKKEHEEAEETKRDRVHSTYISQKNALQRMLATQVKRETEYPRLLKLLTEDTKTILGRRVIDQLEVGILNREIIQDTIKTLSDNYLRGLSGDDLNYLARQASTDPELLKPISAEQRRRDHGLENHVPLRDPTTSALYKLSLFRGTDKEQVATLVAGIEPYTIHEIIQEAGIPDCNSEKDEMLALVKGVLARDDILRRVLEGYERGCHIAYLQELGDAEYSYVKSVFSSPMMNPIFQYVTSQRTGKESDDEKIE
jgi:hypothetical protein